MFGSELGGQIAWLLPAALVLLLAGLWATLRRSAPSNGRSYERTDRSLAAFVLWGGWLLVTDVVFSLMQGTFLGFVSGSMMRGGTGSGAAQQVTAWVTQNFTARTVDGTTVYDLSP